MWSSTTKNNSISLKRTRKREHMLCITQTTPLFLPYFHHMWPETSGKSTANKQFSPTLSASALLPKCQYTDALSNFQPLAKFHQSNLFNLRGPMRIVGAQQEQKSWMNQSQLKVNAKYSPCYVFIFTRHLLTSPLRVLRSESGFRGNRRMNNPKTMNTTSVV